MTLPLASGPSSVALHLALERRKNIQGLVKVQYDPVSTTLVDGGHCVVDERAGIEQTAAPVGEGLIHDALAALSIPVPIGTCEV
jgi:hypothetical protein